MRKVSRAGTAELRSIPGIGPSLAQDLVDLGYRRQSDLKGRDPQEMYDALCHKRRAHQDRCVLYAFRCAVYQASCARPEPALCDWWAWKDGGAASRLGAVPC
jgi:hypothetical protein